MVVFHRPEIAEHLFTWLHLSDLHFECKKSAYGCNQELVLNKLKEDILEHESRGTPRPQAILITGDIGWSGGGPRGKEYKRAVDWLTKISSFFDIEPSHILLVAGNHDLDRKTKDKNEAIKKTLKALRSGAGIDEVLTKKSQVRLLERRFRKYLRFAEEITLAHFRSSSGPNGLYWDCYIPFSGREEIHFIGLNTALLSMDSKKDRLKLQVGKSQYTEAFACDKKPLTVVLSHHPFSWLRDEQDVASWCLSVAQIHLSGHLHEADSEQVLKGSGGGLVRVSAGACFSKPEKPEFPDTYSYNIASICRTNEGSPALRIWPRKWSLKNKGFRLDSDNVQDPEQDAIHTLDFHFSDEARATDNCQSDMTAISSGLITPDDFFLERSRALRSQIGRRRTAYPTDMSFQELYSQEVYVAPRLRPAHFTGETSESIGYLGLVSELFLGKNVLVLGAPGSGKSFLSFILGERLNLKEPNALVLPINLRLHLLHKHRAEMRAEQITEHESLATILKRNCPDTLNPVAGPEDYFPHRAIFLIDAIDETTLINSDLSLLSDLLQNLGQYGSLLVTCRKSDFQFTFSRLLDITLFHHVMEICEWEFETDFRVFADKLVAAGLLQNSHICGDVERSDNLKTIVRRPLYARMLTYVAAHNISEIREKTQLYDSYMQKLASAVESSLKPYSGCPPNICAYEVWRRTAWHIFQSRLLVHDKVELEGVLQFVRRQFDLPTDYAAKLVQPLFNYSQFLGSVYAQFIHYSFFEFLVSAHFTRNLIRAAEAGVASVSSLFVRDLAPEMRHHAVRIISRTSSEAFGRWLGQVYSEIEEQLGNTSDGLTAKNLLLYFISRTGDRVRDVLVSLLKYEKHNFVRTSLFWALAVANDESSLEDYLRLLGEDAEMRSLNRGYLLYYYGDIERRIHPPYHDTKPYQPWKNTKRRTIELMGGQDYGSVSSARKALDLYTFYDFCSSRSEFIESCHKDVICKAFEDITQSLTRKAIVEILEAMHRKLCSC